MFTFVDLCHRQQKSVVQYIITINLNPFTCLADLYFVGHKICPLLAQGIVITTPTLLNLQPQRHESGYLRPTINLLSCKFHQNFEISVLQIWNNVFNLQMVQVPRFQKDQSLLLNLTPLFTKTNWIHQLVHAVHVHSFPNNSQLLPELLTCTIIVIIITLLSQTSVSSKY